MSDQEWFEQFDGPKTVGWDGEGFVCSVGLNIPGQCSAVRGVSLEGRGASPQRAVAAARQKCILLLTAQC